MDYSLKLESYLIRSVILDEMRVNPIASKLFYLGRADIMLKSRKSLIRRSTMEVKLIFSYLAPN